MPTLLDLLTKQLSTNLNTHALASSSLAIMHLKTLQMQSDDPNNGILRIKLTYSGRILLNLSNYLNSENGRLPKAESRSSKEHEF